MGAEKHTMSVYESCLRHYRVLKTVSAVPDARVLQCKCEAAYSFIELWVVHLCCCGDVQVPSWVLQPPSQPTRVRRRGRNVDLDICLDIR
jgi:hypothetical protein